MARSIIRYLFVSVFLSAALIAQTAKPATELEKNLRRHVEYLASDKLEGRRAGEKGANLAGEYVAEQFKKLKLKPGVPGYKQGFSYTPVTDPHSVPADPTGKPAAPNAKQAFNVIGILPGTDPVLKNEAIVIGAHYDHLGHGGSGSLAANSTDIHHGADDNASGTSAVIELARMFAGGNPHGSKGASRNKRTIIFIAFSGEEDGLFGSKFYVNNPIWPLEKIIAMINLDMVGRLNENKLNVGGIGTAENWRSLVVDLNAVGGAITEKDKSLRSAILTSLSDMGIRTVSVAVQDSVATIAGWTPSKQYSQLIQVVADSGVKGIRNNVVRSDMPVFSYGGTPFSLQLNEDGFGPSDHSSFYGKQIPVLFFFTGTHLDYHKPSDTFEKINYAGLTSIANYVAAIVRSVDENPTRPTYKTAATSQQNTRMGFNVSLGTIPSYADSTDGMELDGVRDDSPASKAGLKKGDKIIKLAGKDIKNVYDYTAALGEMKAGEEYEVIVKRGTETLTMRIIPAAAARR